MPTMTIFKQMAGAVLATSLLFATSVTALPTIEDPWPPLDHPEHGTACEPSSGLTVDQGFAMRAEVHAFCEKNDGAILQRNASILSTGHQAENNHSRSYDLAVVNDRCESWPVKLPSCRSAFWDGILTHCNIGEHGWNVGGLRFNQCGYVSLTPRETNSPTPKSNDTSLAARDIYPDGCNPPVWSACSPNEKSALLSNACDYLLCLKAGNCAPC